MYESYGEKAFGKSYLIKRFFLNNISSSSSPVLSTYFIDEEEVKVRNIEVNIKPSIIVDSICGLNTECNMKTGNVIQNLPYKIKVSFYKFSPVKLEYNIITPYDKDSIINSYKDPISFDWVDNIKFQSNKDAVSSYIAKIVIFAYDKDDNKIETAFPLRVVRPLEIKHYGKHELAEIYEPQPVTGCIPGSVGNHVQYSESESETRQNSLSISYNKSWAVTNSVSETDTTIEGISVSETESTINSSSLSDSSSVGESSTNSNTEGNSNNIQYSTTDGENWAWSLNESESNSESNSSSEGQGQTYSGSITTGFSGEGSLPFLAKASGKVEVSAGVQSNSNVSNTTGQSNTNTTGRGYTTAGSTTENRSFGSFENSARSESLTGTYVLSSSTSNTITESSSLSSSRVWNMSESISSGQTVSDANSENIGQTIVSSSSSSTTFSYSAYIPRGRFGVFFRQTSRYVKLSEIVTYTINGEELHSGFIMMNTWAWAPELSISDSCQKAYNSNLPEAQCIISPCGE